MQSKQVPQVLVGSMDAIFPFEREKIFERAEIFFLSKGKTTLFWQKAPERIRARRIFPILIKYFEQRFHNCGLFLERLPNHGPRWNWDNGDDDSHAEHDCEDNSAYRGHNDQ